MGNLIVFFYLAGGYPKTIYYKRIDVIGPEFERYRRYMCETLDFVAPYKKAAESYLEDIEKVKSGREAEIITGGNDVQIVIKKDYIQVNILINNNWIDQEEGRFPLEEWEKVTKAWILFLGMPESIESRYTVQL
jgi:hypothetical protein